MSAKTQLHSRTSLMREVKKLRPALTGSRSSCSFSQIRLVSKEISSRSGNSKTNAQRIDMFCIPRSVENRNIDLQQGQKSVMIAQWENESHCQSSPCGVAWAMRSQWENECISLSVLSVARVMIAQWENECISQSVLSLWPGQ